MTNTKMIEDFYTLKYGKKMTIKKILYQLYVKNDMSIRQIAKQLYVSQATVSNWLKKYGIAAKRFIYVDKEQD